MVFLLLPTPTSSRRSLLPSGLQPVDSRSGRALVAGQRSQGPQAGFRGRNAAPIQVTWPSTGAQAIGCRASGGEEGKGGSQGLHLGPQASLLLSPSLALLEPFMGVLAGGELTFRWT